MLSLSSKSITLSVSEDASSVTFIDTVRHQIWTLDMKSLRYVVPGESGNCLLTPQSAAKISDAAIEVTYISRCGAAVFVYAMRDSFIEVTFSAGKSGEFNKIVLPGSFEPEGGVGKYLISSAQGFLWDGRGDTIDHDFYEGGHGWGFSMPMFGVLGKDGGLMCEAETSCDCCFNAGKDAGGRTWMTNAQIPTLGHMEYDRTVRFYFTEPTITAVAKAYRARVIELGRFKSWEEKLKERPALERLFGALMCFIGYSQSQDMDYAVEAKKLREYGFDRALVYPTRFNTYGQPFEMDGQPPINLSREQVAAIKELGYDVAPWSWPTDCIDDGTEDMRKRFNVDPGGKYSGGGWTMGGCTWQRCCESTLPEWHKNTMETTMSDMTWDHFDVVGAMPNLECYAPDHPNHPGKPMSRRESREFRRELLRGAQSRGGAVSSENFNDAYSLEYDIGSAKVWPMYGPMFFWPIPLTMLVYHDSILHTWWEVHNYNGYKSRLLYVLNVNYFQYGGGKPTIQSAMDALYGCIPDVFPFGAHSAWNGHERDMDKYEFHFEDPFVQFSLGLAKPVADLHREIGKREMLSFEFLTDDGYVQKTVFEGGVEVYANFSPMVIWLEQAGTIRSESWTVVRK